MLKTWCSLCSPWLDALPIAVEQNQDERNFRVTTEQHPPETWHIRAVRLPDGDRAEDWWIHNGRLIDQPVPNARELPGGWMLPGLADAHVHLSLDFNATGLPVG